MYESSSNHGFFKFVDYLNIGYSQMISHFKLVVAPELFKRMEKTSSKEELFGVDFEWKGGWKMAFSR